VIDEYLPQTLYDTVEILMQTIGVVVVVSLGSPLLLIPCCIVLCALYFLRKFYFRTARDVKRLEGVGKLYHLEIHPSLYQSQYSKESGEQYVVSFTSKKPYIFAFEHIPKWSFNH